MRRRMSRRRRQRSRERLGATAVRVGIAVTWAARRKFGSSRRSGRVRGMKLAQQDQRDPVPRVLHAGSLGARDDARKLAREFPSRRHLQRRHSL